MVESDIASWAEEQWGGVCLGDRRRTRRAVQVGAAMAQNAGKSLPEQMECWPALKGSYRLFARPEATHECLSAPHRHATREASEAAGGVVLFIQDTTQLDFSHHPTTQGLGRIGRGHQHGLLVHTTLAVSTTTPGGRLLGMADQGVWRRQGTGKRHQPRAQRLARPKESDVWAEAVERIGPAPAGACWVSVGDRESDIFAHLQRAKALGWHCVVRARHNRTLAGGGLALLERIRAEPGQTERRVHLSARAGGRPERQHSLHVCWMAAHLNSPAHQPAASGIDVWVVRAWNASVEWIVLSTVPVTDAAQANRVLDWYTARWQIEEYHKALKTGCRIEALELSTADRLEAALGLMAIVAVRLLQLREQARRTPDVPADGCIDPLWLALIAARFSLDPSSLSVRQFWHAVARLGGFLARKGDGDPGWLTLWRGFLRLQDMAWAAGYAPAAQKCG